MKSVFGKLSSKNILKILSYLSIFKTLLQSILHNTVRLNSRWPVKL